MPNPLTEPDPPLVDVKVTNPVTYFKKVWSKIIGNEGVDLSLHIKPLTAIIISMTIATVGFGFGRFVLPFNLPFFEYIDSTLSTPSPTPTVESLWKETAFTGKLQYSETTEKYYLVTTSSEAITLSVPKNIELEQLIGKRILAAGQYSKTERLLKITDAKDMEVLPKTPVPVPTTTPNPTPITSSEPSQTPPALDSLY
jgi:hypothetical protein